MIIKGKMLFGENEIKYLKEMQQRLPKIFYAQDVNLFHIYKTMTSNLHDEPWVEMQRSLIAFHGNEVHNNNHSLVTNYFLEYVPGSYARMHVDNPNTVEGTAITLIERSKDLVGGDIVIAKGPDITKVLPQRVGETIYYDAAITHGVTKVERGNRKVLITWFRKESWQKK